MKKELKDFNNEIEARKYFNVEPFDNWEIEKLYKIIKNKGLYLDTNIFSAEDIEKMDGLDGFLMGQEHFKECCLKEFNKLNK